jgi:hypothetical protein
MAAVRTVMYVHLAISEFEHLVSDATENGLALSRPA